MIRRRFRKEMRSQKVLVEHEHIAVALSGGKDSVLTLELVNEITREIPQIELTAVTIDEGIDGYRPSSLDIAREQINRLDVNWEVRTFRDLFSMSLDDMLTRTETGPCTVCGILRRKALNQLCRDIGADVLVTGHNLDDTAQTILMNVMQAQPDRLRRLGPHIEPIPGLVPRAMPLRSTPETETYLCAYLMGLPIHQVECPYAIAAKRGIYRDLLLKAEQETPGTRHSLLRFHEKVASFIPVENTDMGRCSICGEMSPLGEGRTICRACELLSDIGV